VKKMLALTVLLVLAVLVMFPVFAAGQKEGSGSAAVTEVVIPTYRSGEDAGAAFFLPQVERFNKKYEGKYKIIVEESPSNTHTDRIKQLALQNKLPTIFQVPDSKWVEDYLVANGKLEDLSAFANSKPEMKKLFIAASLEFCTKNGKLIALPLTVLKPTGMYFNSSMTGFTKKVIDMDWDEFAAGLKGTKVGFQTAEGGWTTSLILAGMIGGIDGGIEMLNNGVSSKITDFNNPIFIKAFAQLQKLYQSNGWEGAIGAAYPDAATAFYGKKSSVLPDGTWIIGKINDPTDWSNGFDGKTVTGTYYPNNVAIANPRVYDWMMPAGLPADQKEAGLAFFEFMNTPEEIEAFILAEGGSSPNLGYSANFKQQLSEKKLLNDFATGANGKTRYVPYFHDSINASLFTGDFSNNLPKLLKGDWTAEKFAEELTKAAKAGS